MRADGWCRARCNDESGDGFYPPRSDAGGKDAPGLWKGRNEEPFPLRWEVRGKRAAARAAGGSSRVGPQRLRIGEGQFLNTAARYRDNATTRDPAVPSWARDRPVRGRKPARSRQEGRRRLRGEVFGFWAMCHEHSPLPPPKRGVGPFLHARLRDLRPAGMPLCVSTVFPGEPRRPHAGTRGDGPAGRRESRNLKVGPPRCSAAARLSLAAASQTRRSADPGYGALLWQKKGVTVCSRQC